MAQKNSLLSNLSWKFAERISAQLVTMIVSIILARMLEPSHYGIISIVTIFITFANVFVSDGLGSALIQKKDADALDFSSVLWVNVLFSIVLYFILYFVAPYIAAFYGEGYEILTPVLRILSFRLILSAINSVQQAYVSKKMIFYKFFWATLGGTVASAIVGIWMAYNNYGVWALVAQYLTNTTVDTVILGISLRKKPLFRISLQRLKILLKFGVHVLSTSLIITGYQELRALIIGKVYSSADLAYYDKGKQFPNLLITNVNSSIGSVLFPKLANEQDDILKVKNITRNSIRFSSLLLSPLMMGLAAVSTPFVVVVLTEKWLPCVPLLQWFCIIYLFQPIHTANMQAIKAMGRGDILLKLEITKKIIELITIGATMFISVKAMVVGLAVITTVFTFFNAYPNIKLLNYTIKEQLLDILPSIVMSLIMFIIVNFVGMFDIDNFLKLCLQVSVGIVVYLILCVISKNKEFKYLMDFIKK